MAAEALSKPIHAEASCYHLALFVRHALARGEHPPVETAMALGFVPKLAALLQVPSPRIQSEAAWALANIASSQSPACQEMRALGCAAKFVELLSADNLELADNVLSHLTPRLSGLLAISRATASRRGTSC